MVSTPPAAQPPPINGTTISCIMHWHCADGYSTQLMRWLPNKECLSTISPLKNKERNTPLWIHLGTLPGVWFTLGSQTEPQRMYWQQGSVGVPAECRVQACVLGTTGDGWQCGTKAVRPGTAEAGAGWGWATHLHPATDPTHLQHIPTYQAP